FFNGYSGNWALPKVGAECGETLFQITNVCRAHPVLAFRVQHFFRQLRDGHVASADSFQVIQVKLGRVLDALAVFGKSLAGLDDCGEFARGQANGLSPVALQGCDLTEPFCFRLGFGLEKFSASIKRTEIKIPGMRFAVAIFEDSEGWSFHGRKYAQRD